MNEDVYKKLAKFLDSLPNAFPSSESGVELRILKRLFTPEEAELFLHLTLIAEEPRVIARRAKISVEKAALRLAEMEKKGLLYSYHPKNGPPRYMAALYAIGIWEFQVNNLDEDLVQDMEQYWPTFADPELWGKAPQLRTIPVGESIPTNSGVLPYELGEEIIDSQDQIAVAPCICRTEHGIAGDACDKPVETCLIFGDAAEYYQRNDIGRAIEKHEALAILEVAEETGLVLQADNTQQSSNICCCCGDCCAVLRNIKRHPKPASVVASPFMVVTDSEICSGCGNCVERCQMEAMSLENGVSVLDEDRCIGCGLCVTTCSTESLLLVRKPVEDLPKVPKTLVDKYIRMGQARGKMKNTDLLSMMVKSKLDRLLAAMD